MAFRFSHCRISDRLTHLDIELEIIGTCQHGVIVVLTGILNILISVVVSSLRVLIDLQVLAAFLELLWIFILVLESLSGVDWGQLRYSQILSQIVSSGGVKVLVVSAFGSFTLIFHEADLVLLSRSFFEVLAAVLIKGFAVERDTISVGVHAFLCGLTCIGVVFVESVLFSIFRDDLRGKRLMSLEASDWKILDLLMLFNPLTLHLGLEVFADFKVFKGLFEDLFD